MAQGFVGQVALQIVNEQRVNTVGMLGKVASGMRRHHHVRQLPQH